MNNPIFCLSERVEDLLLNYPPQFLGIAIPATLDLLSKKSDHRP